MSGRQEWWIYTGVVNAGDRTYYFSAASAAKLFYQIGSLLAVLEVHKGEREVYVIGDGARWIRNWYKDLPIGRKSMVLCWFHLSSACHTLLRTSFGQQFGATIEAQVLTELWQGKTATAIEYLTANKENVINNSSYRKLIRYLRARQPYILNYHNNWTLDKKSLTSQ